MMAWPWPNVINGISKIELIWYDGILRLIKNEAKPKLGKTSQLRQLSGLHV